MRRPTACLGVGLPKTGLPRRRLAEDGQRGFTPFSWPICRCYRVRLRAHALRRGHLSASSVVLTRPLLGLSFIYHPTPRLPSSASLRRDGSPLRGLPWANGLAPRRRAGLVKIPLAYGSPPYKFAIWRVFRGPQFVHHTKIPLLLIVPTRKNNIN